MVSSVFLQRQLTKVQNAVIEREFPEKQMASGAILDVSEPMGAGTDYFSYRLMTKVGEAAILANGSEDIPNVNVFTEERTGKFYTIANSYSYTVGDLERAEQSGTDLDTQLAVASREVMEEKFDELSWFGHSDFDLEGFVDFPNVPSDTAPNGPSSNVTWADKLAAGEVNAIYKDLTKPAKDMRSATLGTYSPDIYILPQEQFDLISETPYPDTSSGNETILSFFLKTQAASPMGVQSVIPAPRLKGAFSGGADGLIAFSKRPDKQQVMLGMDYQQMEPQLQGMTYTVPARMKVGGVVVYRPLAVRQLTGI